MIPLVTPPSITTSQNRSGGGYGASAFFSERARAVVGVKPAISFNAVRLGNNAYSVPRVVTNGVKPVSLMSGILGPLRNVEVCREFVVVTDEWILRGAAMARAHGLFLDPFQHHMLELIFEAGAKEQTD